MQVEGQFYVRRLMILSFLFDSNNETLVTISKERLRIISDSGNLIFKFRGNILWYYMKINREQFQYKTSINIWIVSENYKRAL